MITSMTGYAAATRDLPTASLAAELKSVNGRFLDVQFRLPDELRTVEPAQRMKCLVASIQPRLPEAIAAYEEKLAARLREVLGGADEERIRQEIALYGVKVDVAEELNRLGAHLEEVHRVVGAGGPVGKRLDFLMQELNREANTLGSKSVSKELSDASLELKLLIEQMREQIQNIE